MIVGIILRHYKVFRGQHFVPLIRDFEYYNMFIGVNGTGKSSILEALDTFFNNRDFILNKDGKRIEASVAPVILVKKNFLDKKLSNNGKSIASILNEFYWNVDIKGNPNWEERISGFFELRNELYDNFSETHYLISLETGLEGRNTLSFPSPFNTELKKKFNSPEKEKLIKILQSYKFKDDFLSAFSYLYIPVETSIEDFLRLETRGMQELMDKDLLENIDNLLEKKKIRFKGNGGGSTQKTIVKFLNEELSGFIEEITKRIQEIDKKYNFKTDPNKKKNLRASDIRDRIIEAFFSLRELKYGKKPISNLSSGERRMALIDIIYASLSQLDNKNREITIAIDEPESSLHMSKCYENFKRLEELANIFNNQILVATHWYGALPISERGCLNYLEIKEEGNPNLSSFNMGNYFEERGRLPNDFEIKSFFDLTTSIISAMRGNKEINWLIVEGSDDKNYLRYYLDEKVNNLQILPVGGCAVVSLIYKYLYTPLSRDEDIESVNGKILCLIDTDEQQIPFGLDCEQNDILCIRRLQISQDRNNINLKRLNGGFWSKTEIEDALNPKQFYNSINKLIKKQGDREIKNCFDSFEYNDSLGVSKIEGDHSLLKPKPHKDILEKKKKLMEFIENNKYKLSQIYTDYKKGKTPEWIDEIESYFNN